MKRNKVIVKIIVATFIFQLVFCPTIVKAGFWSELFGQADNFIEEGSKPIQVTKPDGNVQNVDAVNKVQLQITASQFFNALLAIGTVLTVIIGGILGIQFMMSSAEDKAKIKEALIPYICGCVVIFGAYAIWRIVTSVLDRI